MKKNRRLFQIALMLIVILLITACVSKTRDILYISSDLPAPSYKVLGTHTYMFAEKFVGKYEEVESFDVYTDALANAQQKFGNKNVQIQIVSIVSVASESIFAAAPTHEYVITYRAVIEQ